LHIYAKIDIIIEKILIFDKKLPSITEHCRALPSIASITEYSNNITYIINIVTEYGNAHYRALPSIASITEYSNNITYIINIVTEYGNARYRALPSIVEHY
jgi:hypothetical protein